MRKYRIKKNIQKLLIFHLSPIRYRYIAKPISKVPVRYRYIDHILDISTHLNNTLLVTSHRVTFFCMTIHDVHYIPIMVNDTHTRRRLHTVVDQGVLSRSAVGQLSSLSSRTKWQRLPTGDTLHSESCPTADLSNIRPSQRSDLFDRWAVEHAPDKLTQFQLYTEQLLRLRGFTTMRYINQFFLLTYLWFFICAFMLP